MTMKEYNTIKDLPKHKFNVASSMRSNGYADSTTRSGQQYARIRKHAKALGIYDPERISADTDETYKRAVKKADLPSQCRLIEHRAKVAGMIVDKAHIDNKNPDKIVIVYDKERKPDHIDTPQPASDKDSK